MPRFAANLSMLYPEHALVDRFAAAAADGFEAVEILFPYELAAAEFATLLKRYGLHLALFNAPPGDWAAGERGLACLAGREAEFQAGIQQALAYAQALACPRIHVMAGLLAAGDDAEAARQRYIANLRWAAAQAAHLGLQLCIEPINGRDMPGYFLQGQEQARALIQAIAAPNLRLQMDLYHCQISQGDVSTQLRLNMASGLLAHVQIAGVPARQEPDQGELRAEHLLALLDELGYTGHVGCEYRPRANTRAGLAWLRPWQPAKP
ncbi:hydroxypyruvate isomerase [Paucibacter oligotrophus]|uniref:Hydroxypyruvate isomerase n=1 Tax=Roseateles oligotrophus TaxID=1769250 RepID=A0A840LAU3_9BURK|nr:2-oxo-tetronate isomerase [Roseateles oligotrophus]MBB4845704.1 hydroxypyruvate isomerase [Roseateles oligotrophus]